ncbi:MULTISPECIES: hypothetical protein [Haloferax]|uniref:hypothetical protein n=1 Tax=Haloferax TaxID=2251 RepID=UPI0012447EA2|nr:MULTISPECIES: hypothetical protein [Haloferax]
MTVSGQRYVTQKIESISRRTMISLLSGMVPLLSGCVQTTTGHLNGMEVTTLPPDATVVTASDGRIADVEAIQSVVRQATERDGEIVTVEISGREADRAIDQLEKLPYYDSNSSNYRSGWYIEYQNQVVVVEYAVQD